MRTDGSIRYRAENRSLTGKGASRIEGANKVPWTPITDTKTSPAVVEGAQRLKRCLRIG